MGNDVFPSCSRLLSKILTQLSCNCLLTAIKKECLPYHQLSEISPKDPWTGPCTGRSMLYDTRGRPISGLQVVTFLGLSTFTWTSFLSFMSLSWLIFGWLRRYFLNCLLQKPRETTRKRKKND